MMHPEFAHKSQAAVAPLVPRVVLSKRRGIGKLFDAGDPRVSDKPFAPRQRPSVEARPLPAETQRVLDAMETNPRDLRHDDPKYLAYRQRQQQAVQAMWDAKKAKREARR